MLSGAHAASVDQAVKALNVVHNYITTGMDTALDVAEDLVEQGQEGHKDKMSELKQIMLEYSEMDRDMQQFIAATKFVIKEGKTQEDLGVDELLGMLDEKLEQLKQNNTNEELLNNEKYKELVEKTQPTTQEEQLTEDIAVTQQEINTKCPYTGQEMVDPVKNKRCGHSYDRGGVMALIKNRKGRAKCPLPGCINEKVISLADLEDNRELKKIIERKHRESRKK